MLEHLATHAPPDVLVLDWVMPGVSGIDVCRFVRSSRQDAPEIRILLLTVRNRTDQIVEALESGANDHVSKPWVDAELLARVGNLVRMRELNQRVEEAEARALHLLAKAPDALLVVDAQGRITYANDEALRVLADGRIVGASLAEKVADLSLDSIDVGAGQGLFPLRDVKIRGRIFSPSIRVLPGDDASHTTIALRDVTDQRKAEERRLDFYSIIAHDLRSPLTSIQLRTDAILRGRRGILPAELLGDIRKIESNIRSLVAMINDFLDLARFEGAGYKISAEPIGLCELVRTSVDDFRPLADASALSLAVDAPEGELTVRGDRGRLMQVLSNLIGNAIKFTAPGGHIVARVEAAPGGVRVSVVDNGPGIAADLLPSLFERYVRAIDTQHQVAGTGLGLMIVREIVQAHGGAVGVESEPGSGSTFWFRLPATGTSSAAG